jgi:hypothetical protein
LFCFVALLFGKFLGFSSGFSFCSSTMSCNDDLAQKIEQLRVCLDRGLFTPTEFENAKSEAIRLFLSAPTPMATPEGGLRMNPLYAETDDPEPTNTDDAEQEDTESVICAIGNSPALQELLNSEHDSRRDDCK